MKPEENKISDDVIVAEFDRFVDEMDLDLDPVYMDEDELRTFEKHKRRLFEAMRRGALVINENGEAVYTPQKDTNAKPITFHERTGASLMATNGVQKGHDATKMYRMLGDMCQEHPSRFSKLRGIDIKICEILFGLLMD